MLVVASMLIWGTHVSALQFFGYSIALGGMVYYKLGYDQIKGYVTEGGRRWAQFGASKPILRQLSIVVFGLFVILALLGGLTRGSPAINPSQAADVLANAAKKAGGNQ